MNLKNKKMNVRLFNSIIVFSVLLAIVTNALYAQDLPDEDYQYSGRLSNNYAPHVEDCYVITYKNGESKIFNNDTKQFLPEVFTSFNYNSDMYWGIINNNWSFGKTNKPGTLLQIPVIKFDSLHSIDTYVSIVFKDMIMSVMYVDLDKKEYFLKDFSQYESYYGMAYRNSIVVKLKNNEVYTTTNDEKISGNNKYGYMYLPEGKLNSKLIVDEFITTPRTFDEIPFVKNNGKYFFYNFMEDEQLGKTYSSYKNIPIYGTIMGVYSNGVEIIDNKQIYNFELGKVNSVEFENIGDFVYAKITTSNGIYKLDIWNKTIQK